jgi:arylsulfatase
VLVNLLEAHSPFHHVPEAQRFGVADPIGVGERTHQAQMLGPDALDYPRPGEVEQARRLHAAGIRFVDSLVGDLVAGLEERGRLDRTLLVVTSDHGEAFGEHGFHGHMVGLHAETLHVPLVMRHPSLEAGSAPCTRPSSGLRRARRHQGRCSPSPSPSRGASSAAPSRS